MIYDMKESGKRLCELRKLSGKSQEQIAEEIGLNPGTISRIGNCETRDARSQSCTKTRKNSRRARILE